MIQALLVWWHTLWASHYEMAPLVTTMTDHPYRDTNTAWSVILCRFTRRMNAELEANRHKPDWRRMGLKEANKELARHQNKLAAAVKAGDVAAINEYAADVANCAMFVAWAAGALNEHDDSPGNRGKVFDTYTLRG